MKWRGTKTSKRRIDLSKEKEIDPALTNVINQYKDICWPFANSAPR
jgi:hypothetical protein